ncbi:hypothetical protein PR048_031122 [Dryococelus australis]|uniref:CHK kinase-like domain-containing protein n=1 Tax=Dryococelus australis TaxID=614101 RepID=A0ABQ9G4D2_9NEOP|nr:hypothetical protein PR048_031122 [Dryococelus australis]
MQGRVKREVCEKTRRPAASSGTSKNPGSIPLGLEPGEGPRWCSGQTTTVGGHYSRIFARREPCRTKLLAGGFFSGISLFPPPLHSDAAPFSPSLTLVGSQDLAVETRTPRSRHSTPLHTCRRLKPRRKLHKSKMAGVIILNAGRHCRFSLFTNQMRVLSIFSSPTRDFRRCRRNLTIQLSSFIGQTNIRLQSSLFHLSSLEASLQSLAGPRSFRVIGRWTRRAIPTRGATVAECLARSPPTKANRVQSPTGLPDFRRWESCWTMPLAGGFFSGYSRSPHPCIPAPLHPRVTFHVMSGDDGHLRVPAGKSVTRRGLPRPEFPPYVSEDGELLAKLHLDDGFTSAWVRRNKTPYKVLPSIIQDNSQLDQQTSGGTINLRAVSHPRFLTLYAELCTHSNPIKSASRAAIFGRLGDDAPKCGRDVGAALINVLRTDDGESSAGMQGREERETSEKSRRPAVPSGTIPKCKNPEVAPLGIEPGSPWCEARALAATPPRPLAMSAEPPTQLTKDDLEEMLHSRVESFTSAPLTAPGENFGSLLLLVNATLLPDYLKLSIAAKLVVTKNLMGGVPPFRDFVRKEINMYLRVRPEFLSLQDEYEVPKEMYLDVIPICYGARTTRRGNIHQPVDETAVILMENLKVSGYRLADRIIGMDLKHTECVVTHLARFQAMAVVMKLKKPALFKDTVLQAAAPVKRDGPSPKSDPEEMLTGLLNSLSCVPAVVEHGDRIRAAMNKEMELMKKRDPPPVRQPFATIVHNDFWTNNVMFSYDESNGGNISGLKLIDFQMTSYGSPVSDLLFFLYSSTSLDVTKDDRDRLIKLYYQEFVKWLELFDCDTKPFKYEIFLKEIEAEVPKQFGRIFSMLRIFSMSESNAPDINNPSGFLKMATDNTGLGEIYFKKVENLTETSEDRHGTKDSAVSSVGRAYQRGDVNKLRFQTISGSKSTPGAPACRGRAFSGLPEDVQPRRSGITVSTFYTREGWPHDLAGNQHTQPMACETSRYGATIGIIIALLTNVVETCTIPQPYCQLGLCRILLVLQGPIGHVLIGGVLCLSHVVCYQVSLPATISREN